jgi:hypothetical protein
MSNQILIILAVYVILSIFKISPVVSYNDLITSEPKHKVDFVFNPLNIFADTTFSLRGVITAGSPITGLDNISFIGTPRSPVFTKCRVLVYYVGPFVDVDTINMVPIVDYSVDQFGSQSSFNSGPIEMAQLPSSEPTLEIQFRCSILQFRPDIKYSFPAVLTFNWKKQDDVISIDNLIIRFELISTSKPTNSNSVFFNPTLNYYSTHFDSSTPDVFELDPYLIYPSLNTTLPTIHIDPITSTTTIQPVSFASDPSRIATIRIQTLDSHRLVTRFNDKNRFCRINGYGIFYTDIKLRYWDVGVSKMNEIASIDVNIDASQYKAIFGSFESIDNGSAGVQFQFECDSIMLDRLNSNIVEKTIMQKPSINFIFLDQNNKIINSFSIFKKIIDFDQNISFFPQLILNTNQDIDQTVIIHAGFDFEVNSFTKDNLDQVTSTSFERSKHLYQYLNLTISNCSPTSIPSFWPVQLISSESNFVQYLTENTNSYIAATLTPNGIDISIDLDVLGYYSPFTMYSLKLELDCDANYRNNEPIIIYTSYRYVIERKEDWKMISDPYASVMNGMSIIHPVKPISDKKRPMKHRYISKTSGPIFHIDFNSISWPRGGLEKLSVDLIHFKIEFPAKQFVFSGSNFDKGVKICTIKYQDHSPIRLDIPVNALGYTDDMNWNRFNQSSEPVSAFFFVLDRAEISSSTFDSFSFRFECELSIVVDHRFENGLDISDHLTVSTWIEQSVEKKHIQIDQQVLNGELNTQNGPNILQTLRKSSVVWRPLGDDDSNNISVLFILAIGLMVLCVLTVPVVFYLLCRHFSLKPPGYDGEFDIDRQLPQQRSTQRSLKQSSGLPSTQYELFEPLNGRSPLNSGS